MIGLTRPLAKAAGKVDARDVLWLGPRVAGWQQPNTRATSCPLSAQRRQHFVQVVREGFHIILAPGAECGSQRSPAKLPRVQQAQAGASKSV